MKQEKKVQQNTPELDPVRKNTLECLSSLCQVYLSRLFSCFLQNFRRQKIQDFSNIIICFHSHLIYIYIVILVPRKILTALGAITL